MDTTEFGDSAKIALLPQEGVHCYPGSKAKINRNRMISAICCVAFVVGAILCFLKASGNMVFIIAGAIFAILAVCMVLVFCQTFLVAKYRVAVDYNEKSIVLRYRYSQIKIPFENFDARQGKPDEAEAMIDKNFGSGNNEYLVLDDVFQDACYQTSANDLESREDFNSLKADCLAIADAYGARNSEDKVKFYFEKDKDDRTSTGDEDIDKIIEDAQNEKGEGDLANSDE
ncbi:MAG: hypothetical protein K5745_03260 [Saccharofermentans sp.]|nr:hypothetical protein [Saccharofermentans sp.]